MRDWGGKCAKVLHPWSTKKSNRYLNSIDKICVFKDVSKWKIEHYILWDCEHWTQSWAIELLCKLRTFERTLAVNRGNFLIKFTIVISFAAGIDKYHHLQTYFTQQKKSSYIIKFWYTDT